MRMERGKYTITYEDDVHIWCGYKDNYVIIMFHVRDFIIWMRKATSTIHGSFQKDSFHSRIGLRIACQAHLVLQAYID